MPWKSDKQRRWGNSSSGVAAMGQSKVDEFNEASKGSEAVQKEKTRKMPHRKKKQGPMMSAMMKGMGVVVAGLLAGLFALACASNPPVKEPAETTALRLYTAFENDAVGALAVWNGYKKARTPEVLERQPNINGQFSRFEKAMGRFKAEIETWRGRPSEFCCDYPEIWNVAGEFEKLRRAVYKATGKCPPDVSYRAIITEAKPPKGRRAA